MQTPARVLVVEDYDDARIMYCHFLREHGFEVVEAVDGLQALAIASAFSPDVIVLDISLPRMDGFTVLRRLRADARSAQTPVVTISASAVSGYEQEALQAGANEVLHKPCMPEDLLAAVRRVLAARTSGTPS